MSDFLHTQSLDGIWRVRRDPDNLGREQQWFAHPLTDTETIAVPAPLRTLRDCKPGVYWYERTFTPGQFQSDRRGWLHFGAVEYLCEVFVNGQFIGVHEGRQCEFSMEATQALLPDADNRLTVRVIYPCGETVDEVDGKTVIGKSGGGGIYQSVTFAVTGAQRMETVQAFGNIHTNAIELDLCIDGTLGGRVDIDIIDNRDGLNRAYRHHSAILTSRDTHLEIPIESPQLWDCDAPNLYTVTLTVYDANGHRSDIKQVRTAFREFCVDEQGQFTLNGKRIYLKCAHGGCHTPFSDNTDPRHVALNKWDIIAMKAAGFNCIRYLQGILAKGTLELCDELGMMVYQEHGSSWIPCGYPAVSANENRQPEGEVERKFYNDLLQQLRQDLNHPCVVIWGLLNETIYCRRYQAALAALPLVRAVDKTRLVILSSGSWDGELDSGSVCNPFTDHWACLWGEEGTDHKSVQKFEDKANRRYDVSEDQPYIAAGYYTGAGDAHFYPCAQVNQGYFDWMEKLGHGTHPVFLSEFGVGSQFDYPGLARFMEQLPRTPENQRVYELSHTNDALLKQFIEEYDLEAVYPTPHDLILDSYAEQNKYREQVFSMIRSNPRIIGYSMTAVQDHGFAGEGFLSLTGEFKPGHMTTMREGWAPLRWCMLTYPTHFYADQPVRLRAVLADEDVLAPGSYPVTLRIYNNDGVVWKKKTQVIVSAKARPFAHTVFDEMLVISGLQSGQYTFCATLDEGGMAQGGKVTFDVFDRSALPHVNDTLYIAGHLPQTTADLLTAQSAKLMPFTDEIGTIIVGQCRDKQTWDAVYAAIEEGAHAIFLDHWSLTEKGVPYGFLDEAHPAIHLRRNDGSSASLVSNWEWLYHRIPVAKPHPALGSLKARGILDQNYYNNILAQQYFSCDTKADEPIVLAFAMNVVATGGVGPICGTMLGRNYYGKGSYLFGTLDILNNQAHPAADRLLLSLIQNAMEQ